MKKLIIFAASFLFFSFSVQAQGMGRKPSDFSHPEWSRNATIYEVNLRQYTPEGTFKAFAQHLPRLQKMGVKILWLMPVQPIGMKNRKGTLGSYYSVRDYLKVNPEYGTMQDFKDLVGKVHALGMYVIIDWVANHTSWDNVLITSHPEWYKKGPKGNIISPVPDWTDVAGLDYSQPGLRKYMTDALIFWVKETGIDGFRCDVAGMLPIDFWDEAVPMVKKVKPVFMLAEAETPDMHQIAFDATYSWDFFHLMNSMAKGKKPVIRLDSLLSADRKKFPTDAYRLRFTSNHDENSWSGTEYERMGDGALAFAVLTFTVPGMPLIYSGQEAALKKRLRFFDKDTIPWMNFPLGGFYTKLVQMKSSRKALANGSEGGVFIKVSNNSLKSVHSFLRKKDNDRIFVVINFSAAKQEVIFPSNDIPGKYTELFTGQTKIFKAGEKLMLSPWQYLVYLSD